MSRFVKTVRRYTKKDDVIAKVRSLPYPGGKTNTYEGIMFTYDNVFKGTGNRAGARDVAIIVTDGRPTTNEELTKTAALQLQKDVEVFAVGITSEVEEVVLKYLSSEPKQLNLTYFTSATFTGLDTVLTQVLEQTCYVPTTPTTTTTTTTTTTVKPTTKPATTPTTKTTTTTPTAKATTTTAAAATTTTTVVRKTTTFPSDLGKNRRSRKETG